MSPRALLVEFARRLVREGYVVATQGNLSQRTGDTILITPSGVPFGELDGDSIVEVGLDGATRGGLAPSSERAVHLAIYRDRPEVGAVIHAHPVHVCALAVRGTGLRAVLDEVEPLLGGDVRVAAYAPSGRPELGERAVAGLAGRQAVILARHGSVTVGPDLLAAYHRLEILERAAAVQLLAAGSGGGDR